MEPVKKIPRGFRIQAENMKEVLASSYLKENGANRTKSE